MPTAWKKKDTQSTKRNKVFIPDFSVGTRKKKRKPEIMCTDQIPKQPVRREDFPILGRKVRGGNDLVYLDAGATAQLPQQVIDAVNEQMCFHNGAVNRGSHRLAEESTIAYEDARAAVADLVGAETEELVWTKNSTESLNLLAYAIDNYTRGRRGENDSSATDSRLVLGKGDSVVVTRAEHHANLVPWQELCARTGAEFRWIDLTADGRLDLDTAGVIDSGTKIVAFAHVSNVTGAVAPVSELTQIAHRAGALTVLDACQSVPHLPLDLHRMDVDFAAFSGHKMYGPTGVGVLYGKKELLSLLPPVMTGGSMVELVTMEKTTSKGMPARFEAGTQPVTQIIGLGAAAKYLQAAGMDRIAAYEEYLTGYLLHEIAGVGHVRVLGPLTAENRVGAVAFQVEGVHPHDVGQLLDSYGVAVRTGHHCAQPVHRHFGVFSSSRASLAPFNTVADIDRFIEALRQVRGFFGVE